MKAYLVEEQKRKEGVAAELKARVQREKQELQAKVADYQTPEWAKIEHEEVLTEEEKETEEINEFYCVVCDKAYRSEKQFASHESSKRHIENVEILRQEMLADEENFGTDTVENIDSGTPIELDEVSEQIDNLELEQEEEEEIITTKKNKKKSKKKAAPRWGYDEEDVPEDLDDMGALAAALEEERTRRRRKGGSKPSTPSPVTVVDTSPDGTEPIVESIIEDEVAPVEKESAKTKREKRKEKKKLKEESELTEVRFISFFNCFLVLIIVNRMIVMYVEKNLKQEIYFLVILKIPDMH